MPKPYIWLIQCWNEEPELECGSNQNYARQSLDMLFEGISNDKRISCVLCTDDLCEEECTQKGFPGQRTPKSGP